MKKIIFLIPVLAFAACNSQTELSVLNGYGSEDTIKDVVWANGDAIWTEEVAIGLRTNSQEVSETTGTITCSIDDGSGNFNEADVITASGGASATIDEGSSNVVTITATR